MNNIQVVMNGKKIPKKEVDSWELKCLEREYFFSKKEGSVLARSLQVFLKKEKWIKQEWN